MGLGYYDADLFPPEHVAPSALVGYAGAMTARGLVASRRVAIKTRELQRADMWLMDAGGRCREDWAFDGFRAARAPRVYEEPFQPIQAVPLKYEELAEVYKGVVMPLQAAPRPPWERIARSLIAIESLLSGRPVAYCEVFSRAFEGESGDGIERTKLAAAELAIVRAISVPFLWEKMAAAGLPNAVADPSAPLLLSAAATLVSGHLQRVRCGRGWGDGDRGKCARARRRWSASRRSSIGSSPRPARRLRLRARRRLRPRPSSMRARQTSCRHRSRGAACLRHPNSARLLAHSGGARSREDARGGGAQVAARHRRK